MYRGRDIIGKPIISYDTGEKFDTVKDLIFDQDNNQLLGFLITEPGLFSSARVLLLTDIQAIGPDAVITTSKEALVKASDHPTINRILEHNNILRGTRILTMDGRDLGIMVDLYFDEQTGAVEGYEVSGGLFADAYSGRSFVPAPQTLKIGRDVAFVPIQTAHQMEEQIGGLRGAMQTASDRMQESANLTGDRLQEFGRLAGEKAQETAQMTGDQLQEFGRLTSEKAQATAQIAGDRLQELGQLTSEKAQTTAQIASDQLQEFGRSAATSITNTIVTPEEQKAFVVGKRVDRNVVAPSGHTLVLKGETVTLAIANSAEYLGVLDELYRATGGRLSEKVSTTFDEQIGNVFAGLTVEQAKGRRVQCFVRTDTGSIIAAPGQIVTEPVIERVKTHHQEQALLQAVGLSPGEVIRDRTSNAMTLTGDRLRLTTQQTGEQLQASAKGLWAQVQETISEFQDRGTQTLEERQIKFALGRPVTRVILDQHDDVILNVGELITHRAIASARQSKVLDLLLNSVYNEKPQLSLENLRAPQAGRDAL